MEQLAAHESIKDLDALLPPFGANAATRLNNLALTLLPAAVIEDNIRIRAEVLAPDHAQELASFLKVEFLQGSQMRRTYSIRDLINRANADGIILHKPTSLVLEDLALPIRAVLASLQQCAGGLPNDVVAAIAECSPSDTTTMLRGLTLKRALHYDGERWRVLISLPELYQPPGSLERALAATLEFIGKNEDAPAGRSLVAEASSLIRGCFKTNPKAIIHAFRKLEKHLKRIGNKYLVLDMAELTIAAASILPRTLEDAKAQAHALICGCSWVYQRIGDLNTARELARKSLDLGEQIKWDRNTAFCFKCEGRLMRMQAERTKEHSDALLAASANSLNHAIDRFKDMTDIGPTHPEVGDCFSLLARTYLVAREYGEADSALRKAYELIPQNGSKDHLDLLILTGDLHASTGNTVAAEDAYTEALELPQAADVQKSEIFARGLEQRGKLREKGGRALEALHDYERAADLWLDLQEYENSARARWHAISLARQDEKAILDEIEKEESFLVRVTAYKLYSQRHPAPKAVARRQQPTKSQIAQLLKDARQQAAIEYPHQ